LYYADSLGGGFYRRTPDGRIDTLASGRPGIGGLALHAAGGVVVSGAELVHIKDGQTRVLLKADGARFNDLEPNADGAVYAGAVRWNAWAGESPKPGELWKVSPGGESEVAYGNVLLANGLGFSPDGGVMYHSDTSAQTIIVHDIADDGSLANRRNLASIDRGFPDGLAVDEDGGIWVALFQGGAVIRFLPDGSLDRTLEVPATMVTSLFFGGPDRRDLYITTADNTENPEKAGCIFRTRSEVPGVAVPRARV
ncbi:MAG: SMP-30/gluconolactonase/LRE family protein, partial [Actinomycetota bacterium]